MDQELEIRTKEIGEKILNGVTSHKPGILSQEYWHRASLGFLSHHDSLKKQAFRFVDVFPSLRSSKSVTHAIESYLKAPLTQAVPSTKILFPALKLPFAGMIAKNTAKAAVSMMAKKVIAGESAKNALPRLKAIRKSGQAFTVDLLGEFCVSEVEAKEYLDRYIEALTSLSKAFPKNKNHSPLIINHPGDTSPLCISVKLSALYSQTNVLNQKNSVSIISDRLSRIVELAENVGAQVYCDAEDSGNNPIIYETFYNVFGKSGFSKAPYPGIVLQSYAKNSYELFKELKNFVQTRGAPIAVRLVKGAYWDVETALSLQNHWPSPLFANKVSTDAQYEFLSKQFIESIDSFLPAFAGHNIRSLAHAIAYAERLGVSKSQYEIQTLYGMADALAAALTKQNILVRQYVPLGALVPGMGYLVRRLIENTTNDGFLRNLFLEESDKDSLLSRPTYHPSEIPDGLTADGCLSCIDQAQVA